jgi:hypothetical protein
MEVRGRPHVIMHAHTTHNTVLPPQPLLLLLLLLQPCCSMPCNHTLCAAATRRPGMTREEAEAFVVEALALAMARDASSGGVIRTVTLNKDGATHRHA